MPLTSINEKSSFELSLTLTTLDGNPPASLSYRIDDLNSGQPVLPSTQIPPALEIDLLIAAGYNAILDNANQHETRLVTFTANDGDDTEFHAEWRYTIVNLLYV